MPTQFINLRGQNCQLLYGFSRSVVFETTVSVFMNGSEQRWPNHPPLAAFDVPLNSLGAVDRATLLSSSFFAAEKGRYGQDLEVTLAGTTYTNLCLLSDSLSFLTKQPSLYFDTHLAVRQTMNGSWTPPTPLVAFPSLSCGKIAQLPFSQETSYLTAVNENMNGPRYSYGYYSMGLSGFPTVSLKAWRISYPMLSDADAGTIESAFIGWQGRLLSFSFTDPTDGVTYNHVRCDQDVLTFRYIQPNQTSTELVLRQTNGS